MTIYETEIWKRFKQGDIKAFEQLYDQFSKQLYKYGCGFSFDQELVEDCIQDLFSDLWNNKKNLSDTTSVKFYLMRSMRRMLFRKSQREKRRQETECDFEDAFVYEASPESIYILDEEEKGKQLLITEALNNLPTRQREVMYLRYYQDLSFDEIAEMMEMSKKTAYNIVFIALDSLKKKLGISSSKLFSAMLAAWYLSNLKF